MRSELILASVLAVTVSALEARQAQQIPYPISQSEYLARKAAYEAGIVYTDQTGNRAETYGKQDIVLTPVVPNYAAIAARPKEEPLGSSESIIIIQVGHSVGGSIFSKVTPPPTSTLSSLQSSVQAEETQVLSSVGLNSTSMTSSKAPRESGKDKKRDEPAVKISQKEGGKKENSKENGEEKSDASTLLLGGGGPITGALVGLGLLFA